MNHANSKHKRVELIVLIPRILLLLPVINLFFSAPNPSRFGLFYNTGGEPGPFTSATLLSFVGRGRCRVTAGKGASLPGWCAFALLSPGPVVACSVPAGPPVELAPHGGSMAPV